MDPPTLVDLCCLETAGLITQDSTRYEEALKLPFDLINKVLRHLPPLALHYFQKYVQMRLKEAKYPDSEHELLDFSVVWENLVRNHHSEMSNYSCKAKECVDWEQLYWEAHIQTCLNSVTTRVLPPKFQGHLALPGLVRRIKNVNFSH